MTVGRNCFTFAEVVDERSKNATEIITELAKNIKLAGKRRLFAFDHAGFRWESKTTANPEG